MPRVELAVETDSQPFDWFDPPLRVHSLGNSESMLWDTYIRREVGSFSIKEVHQFTLVWVEGVFVFLVIVQYLFHVSRELSGVVLERRPGA